MYGEQIGTIIIGLLFFLPFFLPFVVIIIRWIVTAILDSIVKRTSTRYNKILELNCEYKFNNFPFREYVYNKKMTTKTQFDRYNIDNYFREIIEETGTECWEKIHFISLENAERYSEYMQKVFELSFLKEGEQPKKYNAFSRIYSKWESKICKKIRLDRPVTSVNIVCNIRYTSPKGMNSYTRSNTYEYEDVLRCYNDIEREEERRQSKEYQRSKMTQSLRYNIMKRDGFRCVLCGRTADDGVKLHVDHIMPVSKGGKTVESNLRTLCEDCNMGKSDKYDDNGDN